MDGSRPPAPVRAETAATSGPARDAVDLLAAERAAGRYWRSVAEQRRQSAAAAGSRPLVRVAIAVDRRTARATAAATAALRTGVPRATLALLALARRHPRPPGDGTRARPTVPTDARPRLAVVVLGAGAVPEDDHVVAAVGLPGADDDLDAVVLVRPGLGRQPAGWLAALAVEAGRTGGAVAPVVAHPRRRGLGRTPHDGRVRSAGLDVSLDDGAPLPVARGAGTEVARVEGLGSALLVAGPVLVVAAEAWRQVGGARPALGDEAVFLDLGMRLVQAGRSVTTSPTVVVEDHRPVARVSDLRTGIDPRGEGWRRTVAAHGPALRRAATPAGAPISIALTTSVPGLRLAERWGDWHLAEGLAAGLRRAGHPARTGALPAADTLATRAADVHLVVRGLEPVDRTDGQAHVLWVVSHPEAVTVEECDEADLVLVASPLFAAHLRRLTTTPVEVVLQATDADRFGPRRPDPAHTHPVTVVANRRGTERAAVSDAVAAGLDLAVYGHGWEGRVPPGALVADHVANRDLPTVYSSAGVVLNDHWDTMRTWGFLSNRLFDVAACATPLLSDAVTGLEDVLGDLVGTWSTSDDLRGAVEDLVADPAAGRRRAGEARRLVLAHHTFAVRARQVLTLLADHGLDRPIS